MDPRVNTNFLLLYFTYIFDLCDLHVSDTPCARFPCFPTRLHNGVVAFLRIVRQHSVTLECRHARKSVVLNPGSASHVKEILIRYSCNKMNTDRLLSMDASSCGLSFVFTNRYEYTRSFHYCGHSFFFVVAYFSQKNDRNHHHVALGV